MRIAYVCADPGVPVFGCKGCSIHVQEVIRAFEHRGASVELLATRFGGEPPTDWRNVRCHRLPELPSGDGKQREIAALDANLVVATTLRRLSHLDFVYERYSLWSHAGMEMAHELGIPGLLEVNAPLIDEQAKHRVLHDRRAAESIAKRTFSAADHIIAVSQPVADYVNSIIGRTNSTQVIANGVDVRRFSPTRAPKWPAEPGVITIGFVGTLKPWHGVEDLLDAVRRLLATGRQVRLIIVGAGPVEGTLRNMVHANELEATVRFVGAVPPAEMPGWLTSMDIAVAPYPQHADFYFSPLKVFEYMAAGRAIVASRIGQMTEVLRDGESARFCRPSDSADLAATLADLCDGAEQRQRLGAAARQAAMENHSWTAVADRILNLACRTNNINELIAGGVA